MIDRKDDTMTKENAVINQEGIVNEELTESFDLDALEENLYLGANGS